MFQVLLICFYNNYTALRKAGKERGGRRKVKRKKKRNRKPAAAVHVSEDTSAEYAHSHGNLFSWTFRMETYFLNVFSLGIHVKYFILMLPFPTMHLGNTMLAIPIYSHSMQCDNSSDSFAMEKNDPHA